MNVMREWRHIKSLKRSGRGHEPDGIEGTQPGELLVKCRCCPHPDFNLPQNWSDFPPDQACVLSYTHTSKNTHLTSRWIYKMHLAEDANFKQKARVRPNDNRDKALLPGSGAFVDSDKYSAHLATSMKLNPSEVSLSLPQKIRDTDRSILQISHCVGFAALHNADKKRSKGLRATGIGSVVCARHQCFLPNGTGDLHRGER
jgi:hypothetical protein